MPSPHLRDYQQDGVRLIRDAYRDGHRAPLYVAPTGSGKTVTFAHIAAGGASKGNRISILVHRQELVRQVSQALTREDVRHGIIAAGTRYGPVEKQLTEVCSVQTLARRLAGYTPPDMAILDECHHATSDTYARILAAWPNTKILGVTATPQRLDGRGLRSAFDHLIVGPSVQSLIDRGFLARPIYYAPPTALDLSNVHQTAGDFNRAELDLAVNRPVITGSAVEHYANLCPGASALVFCVSVKHCEAVTAEFVAAGYRAAMIDGSMTPEVRLERTTGLADGRIQVLVSCELLGEGFDAPAVSAAILLRPTESLSLHLQQIGRALRLAPGKRTALILDHVGNLMRHGLAEAPREWSLDAPKRRKSQVANIPLRQCSACYAVHRPSPCCPQCGFTYPVVARAPEAVAGDLEQITAEMLARQRSRHEVGMARTMADLLLIERARGYKPGWARITLAQRFRKRGPRAAEPSLAIL